jgi:hypothetical protein
MDAFFSLSFCFVCLGGLFSLACCIFSLVDHSKKGEVLFDLLSWPPKKSSRSLV